MSTTAVPPSRRHALGFFGAATLAACGGGGDGGTTPAASSNAALAGLSLSAGMLSTAFAPDTLTYGVSMPNGVASLVLVPTAADAGAVIRINGSVVASGASSAAIPLAVGSTAVAIVVTAADGSTTRSYTLQVSRAVAPLSSEAGLAALLLSAGTLSPAFVAETLSYVASVAYETASLTLVAVPASASATMSLNGGPLSPGQASAGLALAVGTTVLTLAVTAEDGSTVRRYTVAVTRAARTLSADATLAGLLLSSGELVPAFASGTRSYTVAVANAVPSLSVQATATVAAATMTLNGVALASGASSAAQALAVGANTLTLVVTAEDGQTQAVYSVVVTRAAAALSSDASLAALLPSSGSLSPAFAAATTQYSLALANTVTGLSLTPTATQAGATITVNGSTVASGQASGSTSLAVGDNTLSVVVTAPDGVTRRTYTVLATRAAAGSCTLTPTETQGPYPLLAILSNAAMVRSDIREGKTGVPLTLTLKIQDLSAGCSPVSGAAVYIWHCDKDGLYSGYNASNNAGQQGLTYLRGIQLTDANGEVRFTTLYPGWYAGRITHIHFQVYLNNNLAVTATATSQLAFPQAVTQAVYASALYTKGQNSSVTSFAADNVFSDGTTYQMASISGDTASGYNASLTVTIA
jgi:protocatechuate 3,4-dioxygenase beta subunit/uncharacterized membrane protein